MNHVDEGTIHAWLDGALDATQARAVEMHVSQCAQCAVAVAEARGLIAGASRILTALDDVPAGVTPRRAVPPRRGWGASRWVTGIAAALMLAVGVTTWNRNAVKSEMMPVRAAEAPRVDTARARTGSVASRAPAPKPRAEGGSREKSTRLEDVVVTGANVGKGAASQRAADAATTAASPAPSAAIVGKVAGAAGATEFSALQRGAAPQPADTSVAGCYRIATMEATARAEAPVEATRPQSKRSAAAAAVAAPGRADYPVVRTASLVRLDTTRQGAAAFDVRSMTNNAVLGSWRLVGRDSVRVDLTGSGTQTFARTDRVICP